MPSPVFDNVLLRSLPGDPRRNGPPREVPGAMYSHVDPAPVAAPRLVAFSSDLARTLDLHPDRLGEGHFAEVFAGNARLDGMEPWANNYGGHQFGHWAGQLGDGRAISLGELIAPDGGRWELQLKGAGTTPYSRGGDGRAVLRSSLREFVCSEAMHHLGIPSTRALCLVATGETVVRDMFYDGHPRPEPGAVVCRAAPSFIRFGSFELPAARGETGMLRTLVEFTVSRDFPGFEVSSEEGRAAWFAEVCRRTALLVVHWMRVGFVHGVMNTDNMSILGLTIDYGPYGWLDEFDPDFTPNTTDAGRRRYRFSRQPEIAWWNLSRLAAALAPLYDDAGSLQAGLDQYVGQFQAGMEGMHREKLGCAGEDTGDSALAQDLESLMRRGGADMTLMYRLLADVDPRRPDVAVLRPAFYDVERAGAIERDLLEWLRRWARRVRHDGVDDELRRRRMNATNPKYVFRNYLAQQAIDGVERGDDELLAALMEVLGAPYDEHPTHQRLFALRPEWARGRAGCSMLSCSS